MQKAIYNFMRICTTHLPVEAPIYEFGAYRVQTVPEEDLRPLFEGREYIGSDMRKGPGVDVVLDLHDLDLADESAACVICLDTLEHVEYPRRALAEMHRVLRPDGIAIISSVFDFPIHNYPSDYWRFTPEAFRSLLQDFAHSEVFSFGRSEVAPQCITGVGFKGATPQLDGFLRECGNWEKWTSAVLQKMTESREQD